MTLRKRLIACPRCATRSEYSPDNTWRPFCSERCKLIDLGVWASEGYRVPDNSPAEPQDESKET